ncbi:putative low complexity protein [Cryptosporidium felis]|nr:putative low complexity protein [Cryptosporidium felis]
MIERNHKRKYRGNKIEVKKKSKYRSSVEYYRVYLPCSKRSHKFKLGMKIIKRHLFKLQVIRSNGIFNSGNLNHYLEGAISKDTRDQLFKANYLINCKTFTEKIKNWENSDEISIYKRNQDNMHLAFFGCFSKNDVIRYLDSFVSFRALNTKLYFRFYSGTYSEFLPHVKDELMPICYSIVEIVSTILNISAPAFWPLEIFSSFNCLINLGYYYGIHQILYSIIIRTNSILLCSKFGYNNGISLTLWEKLLELFMLIDESTSKSLIKLIKRIPINRNHFISDSIRDIFIEERVKISLEVQSEISIGIKYIEKNANKIFRKTIFNNDEKTINQSGEINWRFSSINGSYFYNINSLLNKSLPPFELINPYLKVNSTSITRESEFRKLSKLISKESFFCSKFDKFIVYKYNHSILYIYSKCITYLYNSGDIVVIQPYHRQDKNQKEELMSFVQLALILGVKTKKEPLIYGKTQFILKLHILDPGIDPSIYKNCFLIFLFNYCKYRRKIKFLKRLSLALPYNFTEKEYLNREIVYKLFFYIKNEEYNIIKIDKSFHSENLIRGGSNNKKIKWIIFSKGNLCTESDLLSTGEPELFGYLLSFSNISHEEIKELIKLRMVEKYVVLFTLCTFATIIRNIDRRRYILSAIIYCKKILDRRSKILVVASNIQSAKSIQINLEKLKISSTILEEEFCKRSSILSLKQNLTCNKGKLFEYEYWLKKTQIIKKYDILIIHNIEINIEFLRQKHLVKKGLDSFINFNHLIIEESNSLTKLDLLSLLSLSYENITSFENELDKESNHFLKGKRETNILDEKFKMNKTLSKSLNEIQKSQLIGIEKFYKNNNLKNCFSDGIMNKLLFDYYSCKVLIVDIPRSSESIILVVDTSFYIGITYVILKQLRLLMREYRTKLSLNSLFNLSNRIWFECTSFPKFRIIVFDERQKILLKNKIHEEQLKGSIINNINIKIENMYN